ncbi:MAG: crossover junction endodeoxyribonuclease RuvC [Candidatus Marinimicrobia bacterium]|nr:crossover junction endodeoxyribonuclease RuvC [Candidatus Neomarinimicrobiota bacterium]|tara:strand:- start:30351 stop:30833 length:483 start_codon:yes stop_codon:yes gene_type:complete
MTILGIDPGLTKTGFGLISINKDIPKIIDFGIIQPNKNDTLSKRLHTIYIDMEELIATFSPTVLSIEDVFYGKNVKSALLLGQARGVAMLCAAKNNIPVFEYSAKKVKQSVTGNGNADKVQLQYMIKQIFNLKNLPKPLDASDAVGIALCHFNQVKIKEL